jgi:hypothetical protein
MGANAMAELIVPLALGCQPEAAVSGAVLVQTEHSTFLSFNAVRLMDDGRYHPVGTALVEFHLCTMTRFGYPNDEAWSGIPRTKGLSYGIYEIQGSDWKEKIARLNRYSFPSTREWPGRHFLLLFHDSSFECIADDICLELLNEPYDRVFARITERVLKE